MLTLTRQNYYLSPQLKRDLRLIASRSEVSESELVRQILGEGVEKRKQLDTTGKAALEKLLRLDIKGGPTDLSSRPDHYLYGSET